MDLGSEVILKFGSNEQKKNFLLPLAKGEKGLGIAFAESEDEKDLSSLSTISERRGEGYFLLGAKRFVLNASLADSFITLYKEPGEGWTTLIGEREREGIEVHPIEKMGLKMVSFGNLLLKEVRVPLANRLGREGGGMAHIHHCHQGMGLRRSSSGLGYLSGGF